MRRLALALIAATLFTACSPVLLPRDDVPEVVRDAFDSAGLTADDVSVARAREGGVWAAKATVDGAEVALTVDAEAGRVTSVNLGESSVISKAQLREIAAFASNPANDAARTRRRIVILLTLIGLVSAGLLVARHFRLREEQELAAAADEES